MITLNKFSVKTMGLVCCFALGGCSVSQESVLGPAATTTEAVLDESRQHASGSFSGIANTQNPYGSFDIRQGVGELAPRVQFIKNPRRIMYFYPRASAVGTLEPGFAVEYTTYEKMHVIR